jgi:hypothetical protein
VIRIIAALALVLSVEAHSYIVTIDPDNYANGTDLSQVGPGLTLRVLRQSYDATESSVYDPIISPLLGADCFPGGRCGAHEGSRGFGMQHSSGDIVQGFGEINLWDQCSRGAGGACRDGYSVIEMIFERPTDFLQLESVWGSDPAAIQVFNSAGERLMYCGAAYFVCPDVISTELRYDYHSTFVVERTQRDIARVIFGGIIGSAYLGEITYRVPEPGAFALFAMGLLGVVNARRRHRVKTHRTPALKLSH